MRVGADTNLPHQPIGFFAALAGSHTIRDVVGLRFPNSGIGSPGKLSL